MKRNEKKMLGEIYQWDGFSDQPYPIRNKGYKRRLRLRAAWPIIKLVAVSMLVSPVVFLAYAFKRRRCLPVETGNMIGLCINADKDADLTEEFVKDLAVKRLSIRIPLRDIDNLSHYYEFAKRFAAYDLLIVILQNRAHIENPALLERDVERIFETFHPLCDKYQIGNAINRTKWGFISLDEYFLFFKTVQTVRNKKFPKYILLGSAVIDFEVYAILRSMWHFYAIRYDGVASLLYVDRRGAPENKQFSFSLLDKLNLIKASIDLSPKTDKKLFVTETNWPIEFTQPYAPALGDVWVSEEDYANYMLRYFLLAMASGKVETIYWHQLIAPGYGLVDNREGVRKRSAYDFFKILQLIFSNTEITSLETKNDIYCVKAKFSDGFFQAVWCSSTKNQEIELPEGMSVFSAAGKKIHIAPGKCGRLKIAQQVLYLCDNKVEAQLQRLS